MPTKTFNIRVAARVASYLQREGCIVCDNSDYAVKFAFDDEWSAHDEKIARFIWNGGYKDVPFTGDTCAVPRIIGASKVEVGVYVEGTDLWTTTPASIPCRDSILSRSNTAQPEQAQEYRDEAAKSAARAEAAAAKAAEDTVAAVEAEFEALTDEAAQSADRAEAAADKATEDAAIAAEAKFDELIEGTIVQEIGDSDSAVMSQKATTEAISTSGIKASASGEVVRVDDVSPIEHTVKAKVKSKNLLPYPHTNTTKTLNGLTFTDNGDGSVTVSGTATAASTYSVTTRALIGGNGVYALSGCPAGGSANTYMLALNYYVGDVETTGVRDIGRGVKASLPDNTGVKVYIYISSGYTASNLTFYPQLEEGDTATEYEPYVDPTTVTVTRYGAEETDSPETYTPNADGTVPGVRSLSPTMTLLTDTPGVTIEVEYTQDSTKAMEAVHTELQELDRVTAELAGQVYTKEEADAKYTTKEEFTASIGDLSSILEQLNEGGIA